MERAGMSRSICGGPIIEHMSQAQEDTSCEKYLPRASIKQNRN